MLNHLLVMSASAPVTGFELWKPAIDAITTVVTPAGVIAVIAATIGTGITFVFMWWGLRKGIRFLMGAFRKGKLSI